MALERLQKIIAASGVASRRKAEELIVARRVTLNGEVVTELGTKGDPERDKISIDGTPLPCREQFLHFAFCVLVASALCGGDALVQADLRIIFASGFDQCLSRHEISRGVVRVFAQQGIELPEQFGLGFAFFPSDSATAAKCAIEAAAEQERLRILGWRRNRHEPHHRCLQDRNASVRGDVSVHANDARKASVPDAGGKRTRRCNSRERGHIPWDVAPSRSAC